MTAAARHPHARAKIVCITSADVTARLADALTAIATEADSVFDAIAHLTFHAGNSPVAAVVIDSERLPQDAPDAIAAIRDAAPDAKIVLWRRDGEVDHSSLTGVVDAVLPASWSAAHARRVILGDDTPALPRPTQPPQPSEPPVSDGALGDIDLVERLLQTDCSIIDTALTLIEQSASLGKIRFADHVEALGALAVPVIWEGVTHGYIGADAGDAASLRPWAEWLARWLALEQKLGRLRVMAYTDELTGAWNRRFFEEFMTTTLEEAKHARRQVTVMVFDIDDFKRYNDQFGHEAGDEVLRETVALLNAVIRKGDRVCRIGGDEFVVIFSDPEGPREPGSSHPRTVGDIAHRFRAQVCNMRFPKLGLEAPGTLSISAGLATFPWDGMEAGELLRLADQRALESKRRGKNAITFGPGAVCDDASSGTDA